MPVETLAGGPWDPMMAVSPGPVYPVVQAPLGGGAGYTPCREEIMNILRGLVLCLLVVTVAACGSDSPTDPGDNGPANGSMTALIDGSGWSATIITPALSTLGSGGVSALGGGGPNYAMAFAWLDEGVGTYTVGVSVGANGNINTINGSASWTATSVQGSGTIVVTQRTASRVVGTFQFVMPPAPGSGSTGTRTVTNGQFDVTF